MKKYEILMDKENTIEWEARVLHRIRALKDFGNVKKGDLGGFVENENNLSHVGNCWIYNNAKAMDDSRVNDDSVMYGNSIMYNDSVICEGSAMCDNSKLYDNSICIMIVDYMVIVQCMITVDYMAIVQCMAIVDYMVIVN